jgi:hypothetical protein
MNRARAFAEVTDRLAENFAKNTKKGGVRRPARLIFGPVVRVRRALVRLSRERYLSGDEVLRTVRKLADGFDGPLTWLGRCYTTREEAFGMLRGSCPVPREFSLDFWLEEKKLKIKTPIDREIFLMCFLLRRMSRGHKSDLHVR